jgi:hypothetical protein
VRRYGELWNAVVSGTYPNGELCVTRSLAIGSVTTAYYPSSRGCYQSVAKHEKTSLPTNGKYFAARCCSSRTIYYTASQPRQILQSVFSEMTGQGGPMRHSNSVLGLPTLGGSSLPAKLKKNGILCYRASVENDHGVIGKMNMRGLRCGFVITRQR